MRSSIGGRLEPPPSPNPLHHTANILTKVFPNPYKKDPEHCLLSEEQSLRIRIFNIL